MYSSFSSWYILCFTRGKMHFSIAHRNKIIFTDPCSVVLSKLPFVCIYIQMLGVQVMNKTKQFKFSNSVSLKTLTKDIQYNFCNAYIWYKTYIFHLMKYVVIFKEPRRRSFDFETMVYILQFLNIVGFSSFYENLNQMQMNSCCRLLFQNGLNLYFA